MEVETSDNPRNPQAAESTNSPRNNKGIYVVLQLT